MFPVGSMLRHPPLLPSAPLACLQLSLVTCGFRLEILLGHHLAEDFSDQIVQALVPTSRRAPNDHQLFFRNSDIPRLVLA